MFCINFKNNPYFFTIFRDLANNYDPYEWAYNGPEMLTSAITAFCKDLDLIEDKTIKCGNFTVFPREKCYPYPYWDFRIIYENDYKEYVLEKLNTSGSYFIHIWNSMQKFNNTHFELTFDSQSAYMHLAKIYCPKTYETLIKYF